MYGYPSFLEIINIQIEKNLVLKYFQFHFLWNINLNCVNGMCLKFYMYSQSTCQRTKFKNKNEYV